MFKVQKTVDGKAKIETPLYSVWNVLILSNLHLFMSEQIFFNIVTIMVT